MNDGVLSGSPGRNDDLCRGRCHLSLALVDRRDLASGGPRWGSWMGIPGSGHRTDKGWRCSSARPQNGL